MPKKQSRKTKQAKKFEKIQQEKKLAFPTLINQEQKIQKSSVTQNEASTSSKNECQPDEETSKRSVKSAEELSDLMMQILNKTIGKITKTLKIDTSDKVGFLKTTETINSFDSKVETKGSNLNLNFEEIIEKQQKLDNSDQHHSEANQPEQDHDILNSDSLINSAQDEANTSMQKRQLIIENQTSMIEMLKQSQVDPNEMPSTHYFAQEQESAFLDEADHGSLKEEIQEIPIFEPKNQSQSKLTVDQLDEASLKVAFNKHKNKAQIIEFDFDEDELFDGEIKPFQSNQFMIAQSQFKAIAASSAILDQDLEEEKPKIQINQPSYLSSNEEVDNTIEMTIDDDAFNNMNRKINFDALVVPPSLEISESSSNSSFSGLADQSLDQKNNIKFQFTSGDNFLDSSDQITMDQNIIHQIIHHHVNINLFDNFDNINNPFQEHSPKQKLENVQMKVSQVIDFNALSEIKEEEEYLEDSKNNHVYKVELLTKLSGELENSDEMIKSFKLGADQFEEDEVLDRISRGVNLNEEQSIPHPHEQKINDPTVALSLSKELQIGPEPEMPHQLLTQQPSISSQLHQQLPNECFHLLDSPSEFDEIEHLIKNQHLILQHMVDEEKLLKTATILHYSESQMRQQLGNNKLLKQAEVQIISIDLRRISAQSVFNLRESNVVFVENDLKSKSLRSLAMDLDAWTNYPDFDGNSEYDISEYLREVEIKMSKACNLQNSKESEHVQNILVRRNNMDDGYEVQPENVQIYQPTQDTPISLLSNPTNYSHNYQARTLFPTKKQLIPPHSDMVSEQSISKDFLKSLEGEGLKNLQNEINVLPGAKKAIYTFKYINSSCAQPPMMMKSQSTGYQEISSNLKENISFVRNNTCPEQNIENQSFTRNQEKYQFQKEIIAPEKIIKYYPQPTIFSKISPYQRENMSTELPKKKIKISLTSKLNKNQGISLNLVQPNIKIEENQKTLITPISIISKLKVESKNSILIDETMNASYKNMIKPIQNIKKKKLFVSQATPKTQAKNFASVALQKEIQLTQSIKNQYSIKERLQKNEKVSFQSSSFSSKQSYQSPSKKLVSSIKLEGSSEKKGLSKWNNELSELKQSRQHSGQFSPQIFCGKRNDSSCRVQGVTKWNQNLNQYKQEHSKSRSKDKSKSKSKSKESKLNSISIADQHKSHRLQVEVKRNKYQNSNTFVNYL